MISPNFIVLFITKNYFQIQKSLRIETLAFKSAIAVFMGDICEDDVVGSAVALAGVAVGMDDICKDDVVGSAVALGGVAV